MKFPAMTTSKPELQREHLYLEELARRVQAVLGDELVGVYAGGSFALGGYEPSRSDLDVAVVIESPLAEEQRHLLVERVRHEALPCPARELELVAYQLSTVRSGSATRDFELNLNSGADTALLVESGPGSGASFWYPIDRSILTQAGVAVLGPPAQGVFAPIPPEDLRPVLEEATRWHRADPGGGGADAAANVARAERFLREGRWVAKCEVG